MTQLQYLFDFWDSTLLDCPGDQKIRDSNPWTDFFRDTKTEHDEVSYVNYGNHIRHKIKIVNSQAVGWNSWVPSALKSIFWGNIIFESTAWFFDIILKFTLTPIIRRPIIDPDSLGVKIISNFVKILIERRFEFLKRQGV